MFVALIALAAVSAASIRLENNSDGSTVVRITDGGSGAIAVFVDGVLNAPSMLGETRVMGKDLVFVPRYPLQAGQKYRVEFKDETVISKTLVAPAKAVARTSVIEHIYPSAATLPANQLKFYVVFSAPMSRGEAYRHLHLIDDAEHEVEHAFLELAEELWDADQRRFTLLFDPGRIKRDLVPNLDDGAPLKPGGHYVFRVDTDWRDAAGAPLKSGMQKEFTVAAADRESPDPKFWRVSSPKAGTRDPLAIDFPEPMDYGLLLRTLHVVDVGGKEIDGRIAIERDEMRWSFSPAEPWQRGEYRVVVDGTLEDLAGNHIGRLFEVDTRKSLAAAKQTAAKSISLPLQIK